MKYPETSLVDKHLVDKKEGGNNGQISRECGILDKVRDRFTVPTTIKWIPIQQRI
jgi:hypothetical protein